MRLSWFRLGSIVAAALSIRARATPAPITDGNPIGVEYVARLAPGSAGPITGSVIIVTTPSNDGRGADVRVGISGLPASGGPFLYHIHNSPLAPSCDCASAGAHLDPYNITDARPCNATEPQECQVGDLSGKHGAMIGPTFVVTYWDGYLATLNNSNAFIGNRSLVIHSANGTSLACANFTMSQPGATTIGRGANTVVIGTTVTVPVTQTILGGQPQATQAPSTPPATAELPLASTPGVMSGFVPGAVTNTAQPAPVLSASANGPSTSPVTSNVPFILSQALSSLADANTSPSPSRPGSQPPAMHFNSQSWPPAAPAVPQAMPLTVTVTRSCSGSTVPIETAMPSHVSPGVPATVTVYVNVQMVSGGNLSTWPTSPITSTSPAIMAGHPVSLSSSSDCNTTTLTVFTVPGTAATSIPTMSAVPTTLVQTPSAASTSGPRTITVTHTRSPTITTMAPYVTTVLVASTQTDVTTSQSVEILTTTVPITITRMVVNTSPSVETLTSTITTVGPPNTVSPTGTIATVTVTATVSGATMTSVSTGLVPTIVTTVHDTVTVTTSIVQPTTATYSITQTPTTWTYTTTVTSLGIIGSVTSYLFGPATTAIPPPPPTAVSIPVVVTPTVAVPLVTTIALASPVTIPIMTALTTIIPPNLPLLRIPMPFVQAATTIPLTITEPSTTLTTTTIFPELTLTTTLSTSLPDISLTMPLPLTTDLTTDVVLTELTLTTPDVAPPDPTDANEDTTTTIEVSPPDVTDPPAAEVPPTDSMEPLTPPETTIVTTTVDAHAAPRARAFLGGNKGSPGGSFGVGLIGFIVGVVLL